MPDVDSSPIYYGWKIVAAILVLLTFSSGLSFYNHAIYLNVLAARPVFTVQSVSVAVSIFFFSGGISGLGVARWVQDFDPRWCICTGAILSFIALTVLAYVNSVWQLYLVYAVFGMGFSASSLIPATTLVTRWFRKRRAMALSIASTGLSLGGVILTPLSVLMVESLTFETAAPLMGVLYLIGVIPVALIWLRPDPTAMGLSIDGERAGPIIQISGAAENLGSSVDKKVDVSLDGLTFKQARSGRFFWGVASGYIFLMMAQVGGIAHQFGLAREQLTESQTAIAIAILPVASIVGRLIGGWIVDQMSIRAFAIFMMVLQGLSLSLLATGVNAVTLCLGLGLFGVTVGNLLMLQPLLIAEAFGVRDYARIFSVANLLSSWGTAAGPAVLGFVYAMNQNLYSLPYTVAAMAAALGLLLFLAGGKLHG
ncbi:MAG TPA: MFS transporter [Gammaproteobacteria bacterium]|jgi:MFS family permease|nr:MFS transporter [Gammaproteobacteria bacterium]HIN90857.1 MFS transporter [Porticoccaceae bacterium]HIO76073.1 MFS transporter [Gammaproteobacteria bacterium]